MLAWTALLACMLLDGKTTMAITALYKRATVSYLLSRA